MSNTETNTDSPKGWHKDPAGKYELRYHDGREWTSHVSSSGRVTVEPARAGSTHPATNQATPAAAPTLTADKRRQMAMLTLGCAAVMVVAVFLPWLTGRNDGTLTGMGAGVGYVTLGCGVGLGFYGRGALNGSVTRGNGWAVTAITFAVILAGGFASLAAEVNSATAGIGALKVGMGAHLTWVAGLVAIWPLSVFWKDFRNQRRATRASVAAGVRPTGVTA